MTIEQYRDRKWTVTVFVAIVSAAGLGWGIVESVDWRYIALGLLSAYPLETILSKWLERK